jgi:hypothetical protein
VMLWASPAITSTPASSRRAGTDAGYILLR